MGQTLSASLEDYLEAISDIVAQKQVARARDIALRLRVKHASVTAALRALASKGLINYAPYEVITLTAKGKRISKDVAERHRTLREFFAKVLSVDSSLADKAACARRCPSAQGHSRRSSAARFPQGSIAPGTGSLR